MRIILFLLLGWYTIGNIQAQIKEPVKFKNELKITRKQKPKSYLQDPLRKDGMYIRLNWEMTVLFPPLST